MKRSEQFKITRTEKLERMQEILDGAKDGEKVRSLTKAEKTEYDKLETEVTALDTDIEQAERMEARNIDTPPANNDAKHQRNNAVPHIKKPVALYSVGKAMREFAKGGEEALTGLEKEQHDELSRGISTQGLLIPFDNMYKRDQNATNNSTSLDVVIDPNLSVLGKEPLYAQMGLTILPGLQGSLKIGKKTADEAGKYAEKAEVTATSNTPSFATMNPERFGITDTFTKELLAQQNPAVHAAVIADMVKGCDRKITAEIYTVALAAATETAGGAMTEAGLNALMAAVDTDGSFAMDRASFFQGKAVKFDTGSGIRLLNAGSMNGVGTTWDGVNTFYSTLFADGTDQQYIIYGDWSEMYLGFWGALEILVNPYTYQKTGQIELTVNRLADVKSRNDAAFVKSPDLDPS